MKHYCLTPVENNLPSLLYTSKSGDILSDFRKSEKVHSVLMDDNVLTVFWKDEGSIVGYTASDYYVEEICDELLL